jgi:hypothetical protein
VIELLINGWPEDGVLEAETCVINIIPELCLTDFSVDSTIVVTFIITTLKTSDVGEFISRDGHPHSAVVI